MFTPPPSPQPSRTGRFSTSALIPPTELHSLQNTCGAQKSDSTKRRTGRRFFWAVILVPLIVITLTVCIGFPPILVQKSSLASSHLSWHGFVSEQSKWKREPEPQETLTSISPSVPSTLSIPTSTNPAPVPVASQALPKIPSSSPQLPTLFPQAFDGTLTQNFSSSSCLNFFNNMTASLDFRQCRPFSFLYSTSSVFINAQNNLTLMNSLIWGTCNTTLPYSQCQSNMASFASSLQVACSQELKSQNPLVVQSLTSLQAFSVMHDSACLANPATDAYCYLSAVLNPSDLYFFSLPLGIPIPPSSVSEPSCSACSKSLMAIYATALQNQSASLTKLESAYQPSVKIAAALCGAVFAKAVSAAMPLSCGWPTIFTTSIFVLIWTILGHIS